MELTLLLPAGDAARLNRNPLLKAVRTGRTRSATRRIVWHDGPDRPLAARGQALAEEKGVWRLEQHLPAPLDPWPPATDHRLIEEAATRDELTEPRPDTLVPVAAFDGRRTIWALTIDGEPVSLTLLDGVLRAVAAERPVTRVILNGADAPVRSLLLSLAEVLPLDVPRHSLAVEALSLADGTVPNPRRSGAPAIAPHGLTIDSAFAHILGHLTDVLLTLAPLIVDSATGPEPVHRMRVAVRRARSAISLFQPLLDSPALMRASQGLRTLGQILGPARDWDVFMTETVPPVEAALPEQTGLGTLSHAGNRRRRAARAALGTWLSGPDFRLLTLDLACLAAAIPVSPDLPVPDLPAPDLPVPDLPVPDLPSLAEFAAHSLRRRWKKVISTGRSLEGLDNPGLHGLRLKAKRLRYAAEFFAPLFPEKAAARFIRRLSVLQERLGVFNDTTVAEALSREINATPGYAAGLILGFTAARGAGIKPKIAAAWARFRRRDPFWL